MPLNANTVGGTTQAFEHDIDARWLMAYAAGLGDLNPAYMDTAGGAVIAHPVFPVCIEWPVILDTRAIAGAQSLTSEESARGVHAAHDLHILRPIRAGDVLSTTATMIKVEQIKPGAAYTLRLDTTDRITGELVARTYQLGIYRGVSVTGHSQPIEVPPAWPDSADLSHAAPVAIDIPGAAAHTYTECARIWNPIHTDRAVALAAGLPDIILHGTATLALAISQIVSQFTDGRPSRVRRLGGRFSAMVMMPSTVTLHTQQNDRTIGFEVRNQNGQAAISHGFVELE